MEKALIQWKQTGIITSNFNRLESLPVAARTCYVCRNSINVVFAIHLYTEISW